MSLTPATKALCQERAHRVRRHIIGMATKGGCFLGASLSCVDLLTYLYTDWLRINLASINDPDHDYLLLSKGHDVPALYGLFVDLGWLAGARLQNHLQVQDDIYWHPNCNIQGVEFHSGSLGHLLSVGLGLALEIKLSDAKGRVVVILGDGELNEGSIWEAALVASAKRLDNLIAIVDRNGFQANVATEQLLPLEPLESKFSAFGWRTSRVDGHDFEALAQALASIDTQSGQPSVLVADTVRGQGLPSLAGRADRWFCNFTREEIAMLLDELDGHDQTELKSETLTVR